MRINNNIMAMNTHRQYGVNNTNVAKSVERLSSGYRINRAGDDAAGLAISEKMRAQIRGLTMASKNSQDAISLVQTAEGALQTTHDILQRMRELSVQSASDSNETTIDRSALNKEFQALIAEIDDTATKTRFNDMGVIDGTYAKGDTYRVALKSGSIPPGVTFDTSGLTDVGDIEIKFTATDAAGATPGTLASSTHTLSLNATTGSYEAAAGNNTLGVSFGNVDFDTLKAANFGATTAVEKSFTVTASKITGRDFVVQTGANQGDTLAINIDNMDSTKLGLFGVNISDRDASAHAITAVNDAINQVSSQRADLGALQNRLEYKIANLDTSTENLQAAESRIRDLDMAKEMTNFTKNNILSQAATAMLAQANALPQGVLQLLG